MLDQMHSGFGYQQESYDMHEESWESHHGSGMNKLHTPCSPKPMKHQMTMSNTGSYMHQDSWNGSSAMHKEGWNAPSGHHKEGWNASSALNKESWNGSSGHHKEGWNASSALNKESWNGSSGQHKEGWNGSAHHKDGRNGSFGRYNLSDSSAHHNHSDSSGHYNHSDSAHYNHSDSSAHYTHGLGKKKPTYGLNKWNHADAEYEHTAFARVHVPAQSIRMQQGMAYEQSGWGGGYGHDGFSMMRNGCNNAEWMAKAI